MTAAAGSAAADISSPTDPHEGGLSGALQVSIWEGAPAVELLANFTFRAEWSALFADCPWATTCQSVEFSDAWWRVYADDYSPVVIAPRDVDGRLRGLLLLARQHGSRELVHIGHNQAEYHTWLARRADSDAVIESILLEVEARELSPRLTFHFLAPDTPVTWAARFGGSLWPQCLVGVHRRGVLEFGDGTAAVESLKKPSNRSKASRLARLGPVAILTLRDREALERWLPEIIAQCDVRQGAVHASLPFHDDPRKAAYQLSLAAESGLAHIAVLVAGEELLAAHIGLIDGDTVLLGLITHAPQHGRNSPGKLLLLMLAQQLESEGFRRFDLTPGGSYKERFATRFDEVLSLRIHFRVAEAVAQATRKRAGSLARKYIPVRLSSERARAPKRPRRDSLRVLSATFDESLTTKCETMVSQLRAGQSVRVNHIPDLLLHGGETGHRANLLDFLRDAVTRLESGHTMVTVTDGAKLVLCDWVTMFPPDAENGTDTLALLSDGYRASGVDARAMDASLAARLSVCTAGIQLTERRIIILLHGQHAVGRPATEALGFTLLSNTQLHAWSKRLF